MTWLNAHFARLGDFPPDRSAEIGNQLVNGATRVPPMCEISANRLSDSLARAAFRHPAVAGTSPGMTERRIRGN
ncbi:MAG: hypothetical protein WDN25_12855 [Acetobacteraceae bacterium]